MGGFLGSLVALLGVITLVPGGTASAQTFTDVTASAGLAQRGIKDGGQVWADFNEDGFLDVLINTTSRSHLYFQRPGSDPLFEEVTASHAPGLSRLRAERSAVAADFNNDGFTDFARTDAELLEVYFNQGPGATPPYRLGNGSGDPSFSQDADSDPDLVYFEGLGIFDWNGDGWLDLVGDNDGNLVIFENPGDGTAGFITRHSADHGIPVVTSGGGDYLTVTDYDVDGLVDIAHRNGASAEMWHREADGSFTAVELGLTSATSRRGGNAYCDVDNDGDFDFFYSSGSGTGINHAWIQDAMGVFEDSGLPDVNGTQNNDIACGDVDNDGDIDIYYSQNDADLLVYNELMETGELAYRKVETGFAGEDGEAVVLVDYDNDGDLDIYSNQWGGSVTDPTTMETTRTSADNALLNNDTNNDRYLAVTLLAEVGSCPGPSVTRLDIGATARLVAATGGWESGVREVNGGSGHGTQGSPVIHFGLGGAATDEYVLTVRFQKGGPPPAVVRVVPRDLGTYQHLVINGDDADGDGIPTSVEVSDTGSDPDPDGDGLDAWNDDDSDGDGVSDAMEAGDDDRCTAPIDTDGDGVPEYLDTAVIAPDGGTADSGPRMDGGTGDGSVGADTGGAFAPSIVAHGSGCIACAVGMGPRNDARGIALVVAALFALGARRRRRDR